MSSVVPEMVSPDRHPAHVEADARRGRLASPVHGHDRGDVALSPEILGKSNMVFGSIR